VVSNVFRNEQTASILYTNKTRYKIDFFKEVTEKSIFVQRVILGTRKVLDVERECSVELDSESAGSQDFLSVKKQASTISITRISIDLLKICDSPAISAATAPKW